MVFLSFISIRAANGRVCYQTYQKKPLCGPQYSIKFLGILRTWVGLGPIRSNNSLTEVNIVATSLSWLDAYLMIDSCKNWSFKTLIVLRHWLLSDGGFLNFADTWNAWEKGESTFEKSWPRTWKGQRAHKSKEQKGYEPIECLNYAEFWILMSRMDMLLCLFHFHRWHQLWVLLFILVCLSDRLFFVWFLNNRYLLTIGNVLWWFSFRKTF